MVQTQNLAITTSPITNNLSLFHEFRRRQIAMNECSVLQKQREISGLVQILLAEGTINFSLGHIHTYRYHQSTLNIQSTIPLPKSWSWLTLKLALNHLLVPLKGFELQIVWRTNTVAELFVWWNLQHGRVSQVFDEGNCFKGQLKAGELVVNYSQGISNLAIKPLSGQRYLYTISFIDYLLTQLINGQ